MAQLILLRIRPALPNQDFSWEGPEEIMFMMKGEFVCRND